MTPEQREECIGECITMTAIIHGILPIEVDRKDFDVLTDDQLNFEYEWLYDLAYRK